MNASAWNKGITLIKESQRKSKKKLRKEKNTENSSDDRMYLVSFFVFLAFFCIILSLNSFFENQLW